jgi:predicted sulfurtransferase
MHEILLYYKYTAIADPGEFCRTQKLLCEKLGLKGRIIIAPEGINGTIEGLRENTQKYINETIVTVCTGGVRCEKASGFLVTHGFNDVYQLRNGIVSYMEKYPDEDFTGKLYVFDGRVTMAFSSPTKEHEIVGRCRKCNVPSENFVNCLLPTCHDHFICCAECLNKKGEPFCSWRCALAQKLRLLVSALSS